MGILMFVYGSFVGVIFTCIVFRFFIVGKLLVDRSDPFDGPFIFLELSKDIKSVTSKSYIILKVKDENLNTRN